MNWGPVAGKKVLVRLNIRKRVVVRLCAGVDDRQRGRREEDLPMFAREQQGTEFDPERNWPDKFIEWV